MTGAIYCGGKSLRMGQPKEVMVLKSGVTLIEHVYQTLSVLCPKIVLLGEPRQVPASLEKIGRIPDNFPDIGPIAGLEALLSSGIDSEYLTVPCDLDRVNVDVLKMLVDAKGDLPVILRRENQLEPLIGRYSPDILPLIRKKTKEGLYSLKAILCDIEHTEILVPEALEYALNNVNTVHDFK